MAKNAVFRGFILWSKNEGTGLPFALYFLPNKLWLTNPFLSSLSLCSPSLYNEQWHLYFLYFVWHHSWFYFFLQKWWREIFYSYFSFLSIIASKSPVAFCHFSRWESTDQISDTHQENPKIHPQIWRPPFHHRSTSSHFSHFRVSEIQNFSDDHFLIWCLLCSTNQTNWWPWTITHLKKVVFCKQCYFEFLGHIFWTDVTKLKEIWSSGGRGFMFWICKNWPEKFLRDIWVYHPLLLRFSLFHNTEFPFC